MTLSENNKYGATYQDTGDVSETESELIETDSALDTGREY